MNFTIFTIKDKTMARKKLSDELKKDRFSITMNNEVSKIAKTYQPNMSKYIERLVYNDLRKNNMIEKIELL